MKSLRFVLAAILALGLLGAATGCKSNENVAARVNGEVIPLDELNTQVDQLKQQYPEMFEGSEAASRTLDYKRQLLENLINTKLVEQAAVKQDIKVTDAEVDKQVQQLKDGLGSDEQFTKALQSAGMTEASLRDQIRSQLLNQGLIDSLDAGAEVTDAEVAKYYEDNKAQFAQKPAKRASHILFKPEDKKTAEKVLADLKKGGDFAAAAKKYSTDTASAAKGGDLGWPSTANAAEFEVAVAKLKKGEMSDLVQSPYGWHIIKVTDERAGSQSKLEEVSEQIKQIIIQQRRSTAYQDFLDEVRSKADIEIVDKELKAAMEKADAAAQPNAQK